MSPFLLQLTLLHALNCEQLNYKRRLQKIVCDRLAFVIINEESQSIENWLLKLFLQKILQTEDSTSTHVALIKIILYFYLDIIISNLYIIILIIFFR